jgi:hypothetical protein
MSTTLRLRGRHSQAQEFARRIAENEPGPARRFESAWKLSLAYKLEGKLADAARTAFDAAEALDELQEAEGPAPSVRGAHLKRHRADLARRRGDYVLAHQHLADAMADYDALLAAGDTTMELPALHAELQLCELHRLEGHADSAARDAEELLTEVAAKAANNTHSLWMTRRALGLAAARSSEADARACFEALTRSDADAYPTGRLFGHFGLGELRRAAGAHTDARLEYDRALEATPDDVFERVFVLLAYAESCRADGDRSSCITMLNEVRDDARTADYPLVRFYRSLIVLRNRDTDENRHVAQSRLAEFKRRPQDRVVEQGLYEATVRAHDSNGELPVLPLLNVL